MGLFDWLRRKFADATVGGIGDGMHAVGLLHDGEANSIDAVRLALARRLAPPREALPELDIVVPPVNRVNGKPATRATAK